MIQCYTPTDAAELQDKENFYSQLNTVVDKIPKGDIKILVGDFNAMVGSANWDYDHVMGRHGLGEMSENGKLVVEFCGNNDMMIGRSLFSHPPAHKVTWVWNKRSADIASDLYILIDDIRLRIARIHRQERKIGPWFNTR